MQIAELIAIAHHAGGTGKTTTALNLGYGLAATGARVLLVDLDPQADLSERLVPNHAQHSSLASALINGVGIPHKLHCQWGAVGLDIVPSHLDTMATVEFQMVSQELREFRLRQALAPFRRVYDYILVDCPPNLSLLTANALYAADSVIIPVQAQDKAVRQVPIFNGSLIRVMTNRRAEGLPRVCGILVTMMDRTAIAADAERQLRTAYEDDVFTTTIPRRTMLAADARYGAPIGVYDATSEAATAYAALAQEVLTRAQVTA